MKIAPARIASFLTKPDPAACAILIYGPDTGLVAERMEGLARLIVPDSGDPFRLVTIAPAQLASDPARLADEAAAIAFGGGRRVVRIPDAEENVTAALKSFLTHPMGDALILVSSGNLGPRSGLRSLFEGADNAAAIPCYLDEGATLASVIRETLGRHGLAADPDAMGWLVENLGGDRRLTRAEIEKLALYMGRPGRVQLEDVLACIGDGAALTQDDLASAAANGDQMAAQRALDRLLREGVSPVTLLRTLGRYFQRLHLLGGLRDAGKTTEQALNSLTPKPFFRVAEQLKGQMARWNADRAATALDLLQAAEIDTKTTGLPAEAICGRAIMQITRAAGRPPS